MGPEIIAELYSYVRLIYDAAQQAKANQEQCKALADRISRIAAPLEKIKNFDDRSWLEALIYFKTLLEECKQHLDKFQEISFIRKIFFNSSHQEIFKDLDNRLTQAAIDLQLGITLEGAAGRIQDQKSALRTKEEIKNDIIHRYEIKPEHLQRGKILNNIEGPIYYHGTCSDSPVLIKQLQQMSPQAYQALLREVVVNARLRGSYILQLQGACFAVGQECIVFDPIQATLAERLKQAPLTPEIQCKLVREILLGLVYLHERFGAHGDINLNNIVLSDDKAKLTGFAFASMQATTVNALGNVQFSGSIRWLAPERLMGKNSSPTHESDIYSFGLVLWTICSNMEPFMGINDITTLLSKIVLIPQSLPTSIPAGYATLITKCCTLNPADRPTARALLAELESTQIQLAATKYQQACVAEEKKDFINAAKLYQQAIQAGSFKAKTNLATFYRESGGGMPKDLAKSFSLLSEAATAGHDRAMFNLAKYYEQGLGTPKDPAKAKFWYDQAVKAKFKPAIDRLAQLSIK